MPLHIGQQLGSYEITALLGKGGMGEVYRARDTRLDRDVAIKTLPEEYEEDAERLARLEREAKLLAWLNHPNIAAIYGLERHEGKHVLVLELVEGETLAQRLNSGAIPVEESLGLALQIAQALEAAHEKGVIHRDLKPANIKVTDKGEVKVLDFGLAKAFAGDESHGDLSNSPTLSMAATQQGIILGTASYMSPEQARGKKVDKRSDVWAFGCVLFEMLTGRRAFEGEDVSDTLANVLKSTPDWNALPAGAPASVRAVVTMCLQKERQQRMADISVALFLLREHSHVALADVSPRAPLWRRLALYSVPALLVGAIMSAAGVWFATRPAPAGTVRLMLATSTTAPLAAGLPRPIAITGDGTRIVYVGVAVVAGRPVSTALFLRSLDQLDPVPIAGANAQINEVFLSPDGQWIGFFDGSNLKRVSIRGGSALPIATIGMGPRGGTWGEDGTIVFATGDLDTGLFRVPAPGGEPAVLTTPNKAAGESDHLWPRFLAGGPAVLFTITSTAGGVENAQIAVLDLQTGKQKIVLRGGIDAHYLPTGHLVYGAAGTLFAVPFDLHRLETVGTPVPIITGVSNRLEGSANFDVSSNGTLVYVPGGGEEPLRTLAWVDRRGSEEPIGVEPRTYEYPRLSPDGTQVAVDIRDRQLDIWIWNFSPGTLTRFTADGGLDTYPLWTRDGLRLIFSSARTGTRSLFWQAANGTGMAERLTKSSNQQDPYDVSPDGTRIVFKERFPKTGWDLMVLTLDKQREVKPLVRTNFNETLAALSSDGRWLAYQSDESGRYEIYVRPFPDVDSNRWTISNGGGIMPLWSRSGDELFFVGQPGFQSGVLTRVEIGRAASFVHSQPQKLFDWNYMTSTAINLGRTYDISPDGRRFLVIKQGTRPDQTAPPSLIVVQNWFTELQQRVPVK